ncbi:MAG: DUF1553 domain-containing protein, partial [Phycisphaerae bacterium]|nr:DUF1553 domain-containing protein [Phycisphaerae bacterium]
DVYKRQELSRCSRCESVGWLLRSDSRPVSRGGLPNISRFTFIPGYERTIMLADGSITSQFLEMFGRPPRDTGLESERNNQPTDSQRLHLLNSSHIQKKIQNSPRLRRMIGNSRGNRPALIRVLYLNILSRYPTPAELTAAEEYFQTRGLKPDQAVNDLAWALINTKEFLYRH